MNPCGRLPISLPKEYEHTAANVNFSMDSYESRQVQYVEGVFVGYRHFDRMRGTEKEVRWSFGFDLSYTKVEVANPTLGGSFDDPNWEGLVISADITNSGDVSGAQVVQVYVLPPNSGSEDHPHKGLVGFEKVKLGVDERQTVSFSVDAECAAYWNVESRNGRLMLEHIVSGFPRARVLLKRRRNSVLA